VQRLLTLAACKPKDPLSRWTPYALSLLRIFGVTFFQHGIHKYFNFPSGQSYQGINLATMQGWAGPPFNS
jgi:uncharacterized membrane protein YphA (DoxX/SURF4 family)